MTSHKGSQYLSKGIKRTALSVALGMCFAGAVQAQSTTGTIYGSAPAGYTVVVAGESNGVSRTVAADEQGRYSLSALPVGKYTVAVKDKDGKTLDSRDVTLLIGSGANVSFGGGAAATLEACFAETVKYTKERMVFGKPLFDFQNTKFKLAEVKARITAVRMMVDTYLAQHMERKLTLEEAAIAKLYTTETLPAQWLRTAALHLGQRLEPFKRAVAASITGKL